ncbi:MAG: hypothetical protein SGJ00_12855 [bacterium]|nr:hypothetical protein [bacterium]
MITSGTSGAFIEIDSTKQTVWKYINPIDQTCILTQGKIPSNNLVFRADYYPISYPGFIGKTLTPLGEIELNPSVPSICNPLLSTTQIESPKNSITLFPNPSNGIINIKEKLDHILIEEQNLLDSRN